jgi:hypothetical protein
MRLGDAGKRTGIWIVMGLIIITLLIGCIVLFPRLLYPPLSDSSLRRVRDEEKRIELRDARLKLQNDARTTLLQGLGGAFFIATAFFTWQQIRVAQAQLRVSEDGQVTERFTRAIDQLGSEKLEIRLGAIYAFERIARNSPTDSAAIVAVLSAFVRKHAPWPPPKDSPFPATYPLSELPSLGLRCPDVGAIFDVFAGWQGLRVPQTPDLNRVDLRQASFIKGNLQGANFTLSNLSGSFLPECDLRNATFDKAELHNVEFSYANLSGSSLISADLQGTDLERANLQGAIATSDTKWPDGFDWKAAGVKLVTVMVDSRGNVTYEDPL